MTLPVATRLADRFTLHTLQVLRVAAGAQVRVRARLKRLQAELAALLAREDPTTVARPTYRQQRIAALLDEASQTIRASYRGTATDVERELRDFAEVQSEFVANSINAEAGAQLATVSVPTSTLRTLWKTALIEGAPSRDWWAGQAVGLTRRFARTVRGGMERGDSIGAIITAVRGTRDANYTDGVLQVSQREAEALVRTSYLSVMNAAAMESYEANADIMLGTSWHSVLDSRTSLICISLSGASWDFEGKPLPDSPYQERDPGGPPAHWQCRSIRLPRLRSARQMAAHVGQRKAAQLDALAAADQAALDGDVAAQLTYAQWLTQREVEQPGFADSILGKVRAGLWREGKLPLTRMIDQNAQPLTLAELRQSVRAITAEAIEKARAA